MNGKMFMKWKTIKGILLSACNYPGMYMVPVRENAPYYHVRGIPSLARFSKKITFNLIKEHRIDYVLLPLTDERISLLPEQYLDVFSEEEEEGKSDWYVSTDI